MAKSKLRPTLGESFAVGKLEGYKSALSDIIEFLDIGLTAPQLRVYLRSKLKMMNVQEINDPFKQKDGK